MFSMADTINEQSSSNGELTVDTGNIKLNGDINVDNMDDTDVEMEDIQSSEGNSNLHLIKKMCVTSTPVTSDITVIEKQNCAITNGHNSEEKMDCDNDYTADYTNKVLPVNEETHSLSVISTMQKEECHSNTVNGEAEKIIDDNNTCINDVTCERFEKNPENQSEKLNSSSEMDVQSPNSLVISNSSIASTVSSDSKPKEKANVQVAGNVNICDKNDDIISEQSVMETDKTDSDSEPVMTTATESIVGEKDNVNEDSTMESADINTDSEELNNNVNLELADDNDDKSEHIDDMKEDDVLSIENTPDKYKKNKKPLLLSNVTPRRSSRNLNKQKSYTEKDVEINDETSNKSKATKSLDDDDIEEITPTDPLADEPKAKIHRNKPIVVSDAKGLVEFASNSKLKLNKKEPTLVIIDANSILSGRGPVPISQTSTVLGQHTHIPAGLSLSSSITHSAHTSSVRSSNISTVTTSYPVTSSVAISTHQNTYPTIRNPPQMKPIVIAPVQSTALVPSTSVNNNTINVSSATPKAPVILPSLTDDMFVVEAPSFIVPYVYEKPPMKSLKCFVVNIDQSIKAIEDSHHDKKDVSEQEVQTNKDQETVAKDETVKEEKSEPAVLKNDNNELKDIKPEIKDEEKKENNTSDEINNQSTTKEEKIDSNSEVDKSKETENAVISCTSETDIKMEVDNNDKVKTESPENDQSASKSDDTSCKEDKQQNIVKNETQNSAKDTQNISEIKTASESSTNDLQMDVVEEPETPLEKATSENNKIVEVKKVEKEPEEVPKKDESQNKELEKKTENEADKIKKPISHSYFENPLGKFFTQIGLNLVQEHVQTDLLRSQKRKRDKEGNRCSQDVHAAINSLSKTLEFSKENNDPFKLDVRKCDLCSFKTESLLVMTHHLETPHMKNYTYRCNFCALEVRSPHDILFHMEAEHNVRGRLERAPAFHQCPNCPFEDNQKGKLTRHLSSCCKKYRCERNQEAPLDWEPPAKIPRVTRNRPPAMNPGNAVYQAAISGMKQVQQNTLLPKLMPAPGNIPQTMMNKNRPKPTPNIVNNRFPTPGIQQTNFQQRAVGQQTMNQGMMFRPSSNAQTQVLLPSGYQMGGAQIYQNPQNMKQTQQQQQGLAAAKLLQQPSISITPLPRQSNTQSSSSASPSASSSSSTNAMTQVKPGRPQNNTNNKSNAFVICEICDGYIKDLEQLRNHMQWIHKVKIHPKMIYNRPPLNCQKCQFRFFTDQGLERHLLGSHGLVTSSMQEAANKGKDGGRCPVCGRVYQWKLLNHVARDHNMALKPAHLSYKCTVCTATFGMYKQFESHVYSAHSVVAKRAIENKKPMLPPPSPSQNEALLKPLKINDEITIIPQPARTSKPPIAKTNINTSASSSKGKDNERWNCIACNDLVNFSSEYEFQSHIKSHAKKFSISVCHVDGMVVEPDISNISNYKNEYVSCAHDEVCKSFWICLPKLLNHGSNVVRDIITIDDDDNDDEDSDDNIIVDEISVKLPERILQTSINQNFNNLIVCDDESDNECTVIHSDHFLGPILDVRQSHKTNPCRSNASPRLKRALHASSQLRSSVVNQRNSTSCQNVKNNTHNKCNPPMRTYNRRNSVLQPVNRSKIYQSCSVQRPANSSNISRTPTFYSRTPARRRTFTVPKNQTLPALVSSNSNDMVQNFLSRPSDKLTIIKLNNNNNLSNNKTLLLQSPSNPPIVLQPQRNVASYRFSNFNNLPRPTNLATIRKLQNFNSNVVVNQNQERVKNTMRSKQNLQNEPNSTKISPSDLSKSNSVIDLCESDDDSPSIIHENPNTNRTDIIADDCQEILGD